MRKSAFSLIELIVVIALVTLLTTFGITNYFHFQQRQLVENSAKEALIYLRRIQNYARVGERGGGIGTNCNRSLAQIAEGSHRLMAWTSQIASDGKSIISNARCTINNPPSGPGEKSSNETYSFPTGVTITAHSDISPTDTLSFSSLFGDTTAGNSSQFAQINNNQIKEPNAFFIVSDGTYHFAFNLEKGAFTPVCSCANSTNCNGGKGCLP